MLPRLKTSADLDFSQAHIAKNTNSTKKKVRQIFDDISFSVLDYIEKHAGVTDVKFFERVGSTDAQITEFEKKYYPCKLPSDYKAFLKISDGMLLRWHMKYNDEVIPLGCMHLSPLSGVCKVDANNFNIQGAMARDTVEFLSMATSADLTTNKNPLLNEPIALDIDSLCADGRTVLMYYKNYHTPEVWFQDLSCEWSFIASTFTDYFRLLVLHLGLPHWQYAYTAIGLSPTTKQWLHFLAPDRLKLDLENSRAGDHIQRTAGVKVPKRKSKKINLDKIDKMVKSHFEKERKKIDITATTAMATNRTRPGSAV